jgi:putative membrane protein
MQSASQFVTPKTRASLEAAIREAEARTRAQVLVVVATRSGRYDRAEDIVGVLLGLVLVVASWVLFMRILPDPRDWSSGLVLTLGLLDVLTMFVGGFVLGSWLATRWHGLARPFVTRQHRDDEVRTAAQAAYWRFRQPAAHAQQMFPAVVLYVSLLERVVHVAADEQVNLALDKTPASAPSEEQFIHALGPTWCEGVRDAVVAGFRGGDGVDGIARGVALCGTLLASAYPRSAQDGNPLADEVIVLE